MCHAEDMCSFSNLGYRCAYKAKSGVIIHYSHGAPYPENACTRELEVVSSNLIIPLAEQLHMAAEYDTSVSMSQMV